MRRRDPFACSGHARRVRSKVEIQAKRVTLEELEEWINVHAVIA